MKEGYESATDRNGLQALVRGWFNYMDYAGGELWHNSKAFYPDPSGDENVWVFPCYGADNEIEDLIWLDWPSLEWGFSTACAPMLGAEKLTSRAYAIDSPLAVTDCPFVWIDGGGDGVCLLRKSAAAMLRTAAFVQPDTFELAEEIAAEHFRRDRERVICPDSPYELTLYLHDIALETMLRTKRDLEVRETPWAYMERLRLERGGLPGEPLPPELMGDES